VGDFGSRHNITDVIVVHIEALLVLDKLLDEMDEMQRESCR